MSDTGSGHRTIASSIANAIESEFPGRYRVDLYDGLLNTSIYPFNHLDSLYFLMVSYMGWLYGRLFHSTNGTWLTPKALWLIKFVISRHMTAAFHQFSPDIVLTVHPLLTTVPRRILRSINPLTPFVVVVTDLENVHQLWFDPEADLYVVPTQESQTEAIRNGISPGKIRLLGLPVNSVFSQVASTSRESVRIKLGLDPTRATVLLLGGGQGMGQMHGLVQEISSSKLEIQLIVIAGRNERLRSKLLKEKWKIPVHVQGFVTNMWEWMFSSDIVITKAGSATITEALVLGKPVLLSGFVPGQEEGNVVFAVREQIGVLCQEPKKVVQYLRDWLVPENESVTLFKRGAHCPARPNAAKDIAHQIDAVLTRSKLS